MADIREKRAFWRSPVSLSVTEQRVWAKEVALHAHAGQRDKAGEPYIRHCQRVAEAVEGDKAKTVAFLHDIVEKAPDWTLERLLVSGFSQDVVAAVESLTHRPGETKDALTIRAAANALGAVVKRADLQDNLTQVERQGGDVAQYRRRLLLLDVAANRDKRLRRDEGAGDLRREGRFGPKLSQSDARAMTRRENADRVAKKGLIFLVGLAAALAITFALA
ncbi:HD domain-containing protein [Ensifer sp. ENS09]|uniref:HD domain-containing protein n=1 Tax=Ensifer sp. ENS09 TaxID=2769263 RepID=UPI001FEF2221|nr:HD domain-containing protein [Ensifer sp. ENS09]